MCIIKPKTITDGYQNLYTLYMVYVYLSSNNLIEYKVNNCKWMHLKNFVINFTFNLKYCIYKVTNSLLILEAIEFIIDYNMFKYCLWNEKIL